MISAYGCSEMGFVFCGDLRLSADVRSRTVGRPLPFVEFRVVTEQQAGSGDGLGTLQIRYRYRSEGYVDFGGSALGYDGTLVDDGWYSSADLARSGPDGTVEIIGRQDLSVKRNSMNGLPVLDYVNVRGPFDAKGPGETPSRDRIFTCRPKAAADEIPCATDILSTLAHRAYRRPVTEQDIALLLRFFSDGRKRGTFDSGIESALRLILTSPSFLFRDEKDPSGVAPGTLYAVDDVSLASRLSFFLWSGPPDDELLALAGQGKLGDERVFDQQITRMAKTNRSARSRAPRCFRPGFSPAPAR